MFVFISFINSFMKSKVAELVVELSTTPFLLEVASATPT